MRTLRRYGADICLGRVVDRAGGITYIGRLGLLDAEDRTLLVDWRAPAAEPFFSATAAQPLGLVSRRRYRWVGGRIRDYWDELLSADGHGQLALDQDSAFIASLATGRSARMRDVLSTIQADQDAIIRAGSSGALVVEGGPGTGKTVVALHRAAYLLYADPRLQGHRGGVLVVGPHQPYLAYVADVLPSLGEDEVRTCTVRDLVAEGSTAADEPDPRVAALKGDPRMLAAVEPAVRLYEEPPHDRMLVETDWFDVEVAAADAHRGSPRRSSTSSGARRPMRGRLRTCRCWIRPGAGSVIPGSRPELAGASGFWPSSASTATIWRRRLPTSRRRPVVPGATDGSGSPLRRVVRGRYAG